MKPLAWLVGLILIPVTVVVSLFLALDRTVLSGQFIKGQFVAADLYNDAVNYLPGEFIAGEQLLPQEKEQAIAKIRQAITPAYLQSQIEAVIDQTLAIAHGQRSSLTIDLSDPLAKLKAAGLPIEATIKPITFSVDQKPPLPLVIERYRQARVASLTLFVVLSLSLILLVWRSQAYGAILTALVAILLFELALFFIALQTPAMLLHRVPTTDPLVVHYLPKLQLLLNHTVQAMNTIFGIASVGALGLIIVVGLIAHRTKLTRLAHMTSH